jgi:anaerobic selenocysteine-containing dehydrogenase
MKQIHTACTYDCPDACGLVVEQTDETNKTVAIKGDPTHPITQGFVCYRFHSHPKRLSDPLRITRPRFRSEGEWSELSWDEALSLLSWKIETALLEYGPASIVPIIGGGSLGISKQLIGHFFNALGPVTTVRGGVCGEAGETAQFLDFGSLECHDYTDLEHSAAIVLWGKNPVATGLHLVPFIKKARDRGAPVFLIDPVPRESARLADRVIRVAPGADGDLALAVLHLLYRSGGLDPRAIERTENFSELEHWLRTPTGSIGTLARRAGVSRGDVDALADLYATKSPLATWIGWGLQRCHAGGHSVRCIDALALLTGNVGIQGGGANFTSWRSRGLDRSMLAKASGRMISAPFLGRELLGLSEPPARLIYVACANPASQFADSRTVIRALQQAGFTVVADAFMTDTARAADLVLPVTLMLEEDDVVASYQHHHIVRARCAVDPPEGPKNDLWILDQLNQRLGRNSDPLLSDPEQALERMTARWFSDSPEANHGLNPTQKPIPFASSFAIPSGKARVISGPFVSDSDQTLPTKFPLTLMSISSRKWQSSQLAEQEQAGYAECFVNPVAIDASELAEGEIVRLESPIGFLLVRLCFDDQLRHDLCVVNKGGWVHCGRGVNTLVVAQSTDLGEGTAFYSQRVRLRPQYREAQVSHR